MGIVAAQKSSPTGASPTAVYNIYSAGSVYTNGAAMNANGSYSGALTANTLKTLLNVTGKGVLNYASLVTAATGARTCRLKITVDGVSIFDASVSTTAANQTMVAVGYSTTTTITAFDQIPFSQSLKVEVSSSLSETDTILAQYIYRLVS